MENFESKLAALDISLFEKIVSQLEDNDKRSLLACQLAVREMRTGYSYLEIGSYMGGSIQPHLMDDKCGKIISIDKRPESQPDERGARYTYRNNSTQRMLDGLSEIAGEKIDKITTIDGDTRELSPNVVAEKVDVCFIDGEHTDGAAVSDFRFCLDAVKPDAAILFHDAPTVYNGIAECIAMLKSRNIPFRAYSLPAIVFVIELGDFPMHKEPAIAELLTNNHESYIYSLQYNDYYRQFANKAPFRFYRNIVSKLRGANKFD
jgi:hypothetical protein